MTPPSEIPQQWHTMPTEVLLERAWAFAGEASRCIRALAWRLKGSEEWIESLKCRAQSELESRKPS